MISVIVPVYKAEKYLHRCVDSILAQSYTDFELLLIDDGSPDNCGAICDEYAGKDSRVRVFHKENGGVSSARNLGLDNAKGEWVTFVDSDDWVEVEYLEEMIDVPNVDFVVSGYVCTSGKVSKRDRLRYNSHSIIKLIHQERGYLLRTVWGKIFKCSIIKENKIKFDTRIRVGEDAIFVFQYLYYCDSIQVIDECKYNYLDETDFNGFIRKYNCSLNEVDYILSVLISAMQDLCDKFKEEIECDSEVQRFLGMYELSNIKTREDMQNYFQVYSKYLSFSLNEKVFFENDKLSPIIKGLVTLKRLYEVGFYNDAHEQMHVLYIVSNFSPQNITFKRTEFRLLYFLIKKRCYKLISIYLNVYMILKRIC